MSKYRKALVAMGGAVLASLAAFGVAVPEGMEAAVASLITIIDSVLVWAIPNAAE